MSGTLVHLDPISGSSMKVNIIGDGHIMKLHCVIHKRTW